MNFKRRPPNINNVSLNYLFKDWIPVLVANYSSLPLTEKRFLSHESLAHFKEQKQLLVKVYSVDTRVATNYSFILLLHYYFYTPTYFLHLTSMYCWNVPLVLHSFRPVIFMYFTRQSHNYHLFKTLKENLGWYLNISAEYWRYLSVSCGLSTLEACK